MKRHLRRNDSESSKNEQFWYKLHSKAIKAARKAEDEEAVEDLETFEDRPKEILKRMSIISDADIEREFGDGQ